MSDFLINSKSDKDKQSADLCSSTVEVYQVGIPTIGMGASDTWEVERSLELIQRNLSLPSPGEDAQGVMGIAELTSNCTSEIPLYRDGELQHQMYCIDLLRRATLQGDQDAWKIVQELFGGIVRGWISRHPRREEVYGLESEETYVTQAFTRFYLLTVPKKVEFSQLSTALQYLKVCLNGIILKRLRAESRPRTISLPASFHSDEATASLSTETVIIWKILSESFPSARDQRLAYLLFHCGLSPKHIVKSYPQEFTDVREISRLRHAMLEQLLHHVDHFGGWRDTVREVNDSTGSADGGCGEREK